MSELIEQAGRLLFVLLFIFLFHGLTAPWMAATPIAATMLAEAAGLLFVLRRLRLPAISRRHSSIWKKRVFLLAWPSTATRLFQTLLRSFTSILIPLQLAASGLSSAEATARLGMLNGMVMPLVMLPCVFTSALSMVALPRIAKAEEQPAELRRLLGLCMAGCLPVSLICAWGLYITAPIFANVLYRLPELAELIRLCAPLAVFCALSHMSASILSALGQQTKCMTVSCLSSVITLLLTSALALQPQLRMTGVILAQFAGQAASVALNAAVLFHWHRKRRHTPSL